ncbi:HAD hydrolase family protein [Clostridiaceae bacterium HSG29]|nr:HAD hydrolase family protein [Clostridiaceae bacterium HSG29]
MIRVNELKLSINDRKSILKNKIAKKLNITIDDILEYKIFKESIDARKSDIKMIYTVDVTIKDEKRVLKKGKFKESPDYDYKKVKPTLNKEIRPIIVGSGPAGMFNALILCQNGYKPINRTMAIGDNNNDASMLKEANIGIAMENATKLAKENADFITTSNSNNGVLNALKKYI